MAANFLQARNIFKAYDGVQALNDVSMAVGKGEIHCLVGENGSGKSTLIKIIGGVVEADRGEIVIEGKAHRHLQAIDAIREGVQIIYQDLALYPNLTVAENISLNQMIERRTRLVNWRGMRALAAKSLEEIGESIDLDERVQNLSIAKKQIVAITRAMTHGARLIIMDEPTSAITKDEVEHLFSVILGLKQKGIATLFISHKLSEVFEIAENVTILRDGKKVGDFTAGDLDDEKLTFLMTGQRISYSPFAFDEKKRSALPVLEVRRLTKARQFSDISFKVWAGEILGITGLIGSGRTEMALALFGLNRPDSGEILMDGKPVKVGSPEAAKRLGIGYLPEDRLSQGLFVTQSIGDNIIVTIVRRLLTALRLINPAERRKAELHWIDELRIKTPSPRIPAFSLSGGNQQRVVLAKWLATNPRLFIIDGPTIGIDIASKRNIHEVIRGLAASGMTIIIISDEIPEILHNCNRILVMRKGRIEREIPDAARVSGEELFNLVSGKLLDEVR